MNRYEFKLVEVFYEQELARLKIVSCDEKMDSLRNLANKRRMEDGLDRLVGISEELKLYNDTPVLSTKDIGPGFITIDEPDEPLPPEVFEPLKPTYINITRDMVKERTEQSYKTLDDIAHGIEENKVLTSTSKDDKVKKVVKKKKPTLWD